MQITPKDLSTIKLIIYCNLLNKLMLKKYLNYNYYIKVNVLYNNLLY